jgi:hypothetical protein
VRRDHIDRRRSQWTRRTFPNSQSLGAEAGPPAVTPPNHWASRWLAAPAPPLASASGLRVSRPREVSWPQVGAGSCEARVRGVAGASPSSHPVAPRSCASHCGSRVQAQASWAAGPERLGLWRLAAACTCDPRLAPGSSSATQVPEVHASRAAGEPVHAACQTARTSPRVPLPAHQIGSLIASETLCAYYRNKRKVFPRALVGRYDFSALQDSSKKVTEEKLFPRTRTVLS